MESSFPSFTAAASLFVISIFLVRSNSGIERRPRLNSYGTRKLDDLSDSPNRSTSEVIHARKEDLIGQTPLVKKMHKLSSTSQPLIVGVAGGTGSGKTTLSRAIYRAMMEDPSRPAMAEHHVTYITHDSYYKDLRHLTPSQRENRNFDHPEALDTDLLIQHIKELKAGRSAQIPKYDFATHTRVADDYEEALPSPIVLIEGILILADKELVDLLDIKIFVDTEDDIRFIRRLGRDTVERKRDVESVINQYMKTVRPMHKEFVEPSKYAADIIVPMGVNEVALDLVVSRLRDSSAGRGIDFSVK
jgi:uridine kinase